MTRLDCNKLPAIVLLTATVLGVTACSEAPDSTAALDQSEPAVVTASHNEPRNEVQLRWTEHGIPHVKANSWEGLGYGFAHAIAANTICVLAREFVTVRGEQAKFFGATEANINQDAFHRALLHQDKLNEYLSYASADSAAMDAGYIKGYNDYIDSHRGAMPESCNNAPWITAINESDLARISLGVGIRYGLGRVANQIASSEPNLELAQLQPLDLEIDRDMIGSNALGFGSALTESGRGVLMGNPHYPWQGSSRFHMAHLTYPGEIDVMGVGLISTARIAIGFTEYVAWTHTVSTALRFTMFRLDLVPGNPMAYRLGDEVHDIEAVEIQVEIPEGMATRTVHMTHLGPVVAGQGTPWTDENVYVIRDVNYENYRSSDQYEISVMRAMWRSCARH